ncbi:MAG TPA: hypothetical protein VGD05_07070 [Pyrinomonadaceae bacterium]|jgi:hypothetical protein
MSEILKNYCADHQCDCFDNEIEQLQDTIKQLQAERDRLREALKDTTLANKSGIKEANK